MSTKKKALDTSSYEQATLTFKEVETIYNSGTLENRDLGTLMEIKGVYNKVKTKVGDREREVDKLIKEKVQDEPAGPVRQLDFDTLAMSGEVVDTVTYDLKTSAKKFVKIASKYGDTDKYYESKLKKDLIIKDYTEGTMESSLHSYIEERRENQFKLERVKKDDK